MKEMTIKEHTKELSKRLLIIFLVMVVIFFIAFYYSKYIIELIINYYNISQYIVLLSPMEFLNTQFKLASYISIITIIPFLLLQILLFCNSSIDKKYVFKIIKYLIGSIIFLLIGVAFAFFVFIPQTINFFLSISNITNVWGLESVMNYILFSILAFGCIFQVSVLIPAMDKIGIIKSKKLSEYRKYVFVICFIISGIITPSISVVPQIIMGLPLYLCFELGLLFSKFNGGKNVRTN